MGASRSSVLVEISCGKPILTKRPGAPVNDVDPYFYGITIYIQFLDHNPPHIHAIYQSFKAQYSIGEAKLLKGKMPNKADQLICEWLRLRKQELMADWDLAKDGKPVYPVLPLE